MKSLDWVFIFALIAGIAGLLQIIDILIKWFAQKKADAQERTDSSDRRSDNVLRQARNQNRFAMLLFISFFVSQIFYPDLRLTGQKVLLTFFAAVIFAIQVFLTFIFWLIKILDHSIPNK